MEMRKNSVSGGGKNIIVLFFISTIAYWIIGPFFLEAGVYTYGNAIPTLTMLFSVFLFWQTALFIREQKQTRFMLPFFFMAVLYDILGTFIYYALFFSFAWIAIETLFLVCLIWIGAVLYYYTNNNQP